MANGVLRYPESYVIKGLTWSPATRAPESGPNPLGPDEDVNYGFFFDWPGRYPQGHKVFDYWLKGQFKEHYAVDLSLLNDINANTIRNYTIIGINKADYINILDECWRNDIMVILTVAMSKEELESRSYIEVVEACKDHPALLMWSLGNEWNMEYNKYWGYKSIIEAAKATNNAALVIKEIDRNHPVSSCLGDRFTDKDSDNTTEAIFKVCPEVDVWGFNIYRGASFGGLFEQIKELTAKPFYVSEFGTDSFRSEDFKIIDSYYAAECKGIEDEDMQAGFVLGLWAELAKELSSYDSENQCLGGLVHEFNDSLWKVGSYHAGLGGLIDYDSDIGKHAYYQYNNEGFFISRGHPDHVANEEYFGIVDADRKPKKIYYQLKKFYNELKIE